MQPQTEEREEHVVQAGKQGTRPFAYLTSWHYCPPCPSSALFQIAFLVWPVVGLVGGPTVSRGASLSHILALYHIYV